MTVRCASYLHEAPGERRLSLSLNEEDYTELSPMYGYYAEPRLATFTEELEPRGGVSAGGTVVTLRGSGFDVLPDAGATFARCRWGDIHAEGNDTVPLLVNATVLTCPTAPLPVGQRNLSIALNGQTFIATNLQLHVYEQPSRFEQVALNTSALGLGEAKYFGRLVGAPVGGAGPTPEVWLRGEGFLAFQNETTPLSLRKLRCRWTTGGGGGGRRRRGGGSASGASTSGGGSSSSSSTTTTTAALALDVVTSPILVEETLVVCPAAAAPTPGEASLLVALNAVDYTDTGMRIRYYTQPSAFAVHRTPEARRVRRHQGPSCATASSRRAASTPAARARPSLARASPPSARRRTSPRACGAARSRRRPPSPTTASSAPRPRGAPRRGRRGRRRRRRRRPPPPPPPPPPPRSRSP